jgi:hypothetical protein
VLFLAAAPLLPAVVLGSVARLPWPVTMVLSTVVVVRPAVFTVRERRRRGRAGRAGAMRLTAPPGRNTCRRDAEGMAVASFALGLIGLIGVVGVVALDPFLGPIAVVPGIAGLLLPTVLPAVGRGVSWTVLGRVPGRRGFASAGSSQAEQ